MRAPKRPGVIGSDLMTSKPCPVCYAPLVKTDRGLVCSGYGKHQAAA